MRAARELARPLAIIIDSRVGSGRPCGEIAGSGEELHKYNAEETHRGILMCAVVCC